MLEAALPVGGGEGIGEVVVVNVLALTQLAVEDCGLCVDSVCTSQIQRNGIEGSEHTNVGSDGCIVLSVAIAVGGDIDCQRDVELNSY